MLLKNIKGLVREDYSDSVLKKSLAKELKNRHAIHDRLKILSPHQLAQVCGQLSLHGVQKQRYRPRMMKAISNYCFRKYPDAPLTNLQKIMESNTDGDNAQSTSNIFFYDFETFLIIFIDSYGISNSFYIQI